MNKLFLLIAVSFCASCGVNSRDAVPRSYVKLTRDYLLDAMKNDYMIASGYGWGLQGRKGEFIISLSREGNYTIEEARIMLVAKIEQLLKMINEREDLRPFLQQYPADISNINFSMDFYLAGEDPYPEPIIVYVPLYDDGVIGYNIGERGHENMKTLHEEPYEEALQWVKENAPWALEECLGRT